MQLNFLQLETFGISIMHGIFPWLNIEFNTANYEDYQGEELKGVNVGRKGGC